MFCHRAWAKTAERRKKDDERQQEMQKTEMLEKQEREKRCEVPEEEGMQEHSGDMEDEEFSLGEA